MQALRWTTLLFVVTQACSSLEAEDFAPEEADECIHEEARPLPTLAAATLRPKVSPRAQRPEAPQDAKEAILVDSESALDGARPKLKVTMVDVGQGDGFFVEFPNGKTLAVDGGPNGRKFAEYLRSRGIDQVDYAVLSHGHSDHYTGLNAIMGLVPADCRPRIYDPGFDLRDNKGYGKFRAAAGCRYQAATLGGTLHLDPNVEVSVLSAHAQPFGGSRDSHGINNTSVVLRIKYGRFSILFEGDAEKPAEEGTFENLYPQLRSTILKAGHHGSCTATATSYLGAAAPQYVLISAAQGNTYGLPHCQTIGKLKAHPGLRWARTDENGTVTVTSDGISYAVERSYGEENSDACPRDCASPEDF